MNLNEFFSYFGIKKPKHIVIEKRKQGFYALSKPLMNLKAKEKGVLIYNGNDQEITPAFCSVFNKQITKHIIKINKDIFNELINNYKASINCNDEYIAVAYKGIISFICKKHEGYYKPILDIR